MGVVLLDDDQSLPFPNPEEADAQGLIALSKQLGAQRLITAYRQGIFPWMKLDEAPFYWCWFSPDPRMCLYPSEFKISRSLKKKPSRKNISKFGWIRILKR